MAASTNDFARSITEVSSFKNEEPIDTILQILTTHLDVPLATLWKIKYRSNSICAKSRYTRTYKPNPANHEDHTEFVCPICNHVSEIFGRKEFIVGNKVLIRDLYELEEDCVFNTASRLKKIGTHQSISIPLNSFVRPKLPTGEIDQRPSYFLNIYNNEHNPVIFNESVVEEILDSASNRISTILSSQIEKKQLLIQDKLKYISDLESSSVYDIFEYVTDEIIPSLFQCQNSMILWRNAGSHRYNLVAFRPRLKIAVHYKIEEIAKIPEFLQKYVAEGSAIINREDLEKSGLRTLSRLNGVIFAPISTGTSGGEPNGFIILAGKISPLAFRTNSQTSVPDFFDWEDELLLNNLASMLGFICDLLHTNDRRKQLADQIAHEMLLPATAIYSNAQGVGHYFNNDERMPRETKLRRIENIRRYAQLQMNLCDGIVQVLSDDGAAPNDNYDPAKKIDLTKACIDVKYMVFPWCEKHKVKNDNIYVAPNLPYLFIDRTVVNQIFINLLSNSIKYSKAGFSEFSVKVENDFVKSGSLPNVVRERLDRLKLHERWFREGHLITVEDWGVGIPAGYEERVFDRHMRAPGAEVHDSRGSGLGLAIVKRLVDDHFGVIWVENRSNPTIISMYFPKIIETKRYTEHNIWLEGRFDN